MAADLTAASVETLAASLVILDQMLADHVERGEECDALRRVLAETENEMCERFPSCLAAAMAWVDDLDATGSLAAAILAALPAGALVPADPTPAAVAVRMLAARGAL